MAKGLIQTANWRSTTLIVSETALIIGAVAASVYFRVGGHAWPAVLADMLPKALVITSICQVCLYYGDLYDNPHVAKNRAELLIRTLQALGVTLLILAAVYTLFPKLTVDRGVLAPAAGLAVGAVVAWRFVFGWVTVQVGPRERLLLVGGVQEDASSARAEAGGGYRGRRRRPLGDDADHVRAGGGGETHFAGAGVLLAAARGTRWPDLHGPQAAIDDGRRRARHRSGVVARWIRRAHHAARPHHAAHAARRAPAVLEHSR